MLESPSEATSRHSQREDMSNRLLVRIAALIGRLMPYLSANTLGKGVGFRTEHASVNCFVMWRTTYKVTCAARRKLSRCRAVSSVLAVVGETVYAGRIKIKIFTNCHATPFQCRQYSPLNLRRNSFCRFEQASLERALTFRQIMNMQKSRRD